MACISSVFGVKSSFGGIGDEKFCPKGSHVSHMPVPHRED